MSCDEPKVIHLADYQAPDYLIDETHLTFELYEDHSLVHAQLVMRRNPARAGSDETLPVLLLDGQDLQLQRLCLDDRELQDSEYSYDGSLLSLQPEASHFVIDSTVLIHPERNTALEGLYKSGSMFCTQCEA